MYELSEPGVKYRKSFRPFAPSVLREDVADWFDFDGDGPYMLVARGMAQRCQLGLARPM